MNALDCLKDAHHRLSSKLTVLTSALTLGEEARWVIREVCFSISKQLREHVTFEEQVVKAWKKELIPLSGHHLEQMATGHDEACQRFQEITWLLWADGGSQWAMEDLRVLLLSMIVSLRYQITEQERTLFPLLQLVVAPHGVFAGEEVSTPSGLNEHMTVQQVLKRYPQTQPIFEELCVGAFEQYDTLAEVAWCHGVGSVGLLTRLEEAIVDPNTLVE